MRLASSIRQSAGSRLGGREIKRTYPCIRSLVFRRADIAGYLSGIGHVVVRQHVRIGHAQGFQSKYTRHLLQINKTGIGVLRVPREVVKGGVIYAVWAA